MNGVSGGGRAAPHAHAAKTATTTVTMTPGPTDRRATFKTPPSTLTDSQLSQDARRAKVRQALPPDLHELFFLV
jgi:hypothetical protein